MTGFLHGVRWLTGGGVRAPRPTDGKKYLGRAVGDAGPYGEVVGADAPVRPVRRLLGVRRGGALPRPRATARVAPTEGYKRLCGAGRCGERTERCQWQRKRSERVAAVKISSVRRKAAWKFWAPQQDHRPLRRGSGNSSVIGRGRTPPLRMDERRYGGRTEPSAPTKAQQDLRHKSGRMDLTFGGQNFLAVRSQSLTWMPLSVAALVAFCRSFSLFLFSSCTSSSSRFS